MPIIAILGVMHVKICVLYELRDAFYFDQSQVSNHSLITFLSKWSTRRSQHTFHQLVRPIALRGMIVGSQCCFPIL